MKILLENRGGDLNKPMVLPVENRVGEGGGLELFLQRENKKNPWYFSMVPNGAQYFVTKHDLFVWVKHVGHL